jgi:membrane protein YdbS with pleckstrin-like domain
MPNNTNEEAQARRRRDAWNSAIIATVWMLLSASIMLLLRHFYVPEGFWSAVMLIAGLLELGMIIPVWILLKTRLKEIEGGEEDAAAQY